MASTTTNYDVKVRYQIDDKTAGGLDGIKRRSDAAARSTSSLSRSLKRMAGIAIGAFGIRKALDATIGFNRQLDMTKAKLRTVIQLNTGRSFLNSTKEAGILMKQFREDAKSSAGTFKDMADFGTTIAGPVTLAGGTLKDLREITKGSVVAAAAFGERADLASRDIQQALAGTLGMKDRFARALLQPMGIDLKKFNAATAPQRLKALKAALSQKGIKDAATAYQNSFEGVFSTMKSNLQEFGGKVGKKLFDKLTGGMKNVNLWFKNNEKAVDRFANKLANGMVKAFTMVKDAIKAIVAQKDLLILLAKAALMAKVAGGIMGLGGGGAGKGLGAFVSRLGAATQGLALLAIGAQYAANRILRTQEKQLKLQGEKSPTLLMDQARMLGGANVGRGQGISAASLKFNAAEAQRLGLWRDTDATETPVLSGAGAIDARAMGREQSLSKGQFTGGDKVSAMRVVNMFKRSKFGTGGGAGGVNLAKVAEQFKIPLQSLDMKRAGAEGQKRFGKDLKDLTPGQMGEAIMAVTSGRTDEYRKMQEFLTGLGRAMALNRRATKEMETAHAKRMADNLGITVAEAIERMRIKAWQSDPGIIAMAKAWNSNGVPKSSTDPFKDLKGKTNVKVGKVVVNVESNDPDKFAMGLEGLFADLAQNGAQASFAQRGF